MFVATVDSAWQLATVGGFALTAGAGVVGLIFRGAAVAWRDERDAAVDKAERLTAKVEEQAKKIGALEHKVEILERQTNIEELGLQQTEEHKKIVAALEDVRTGLHANTTVLEFLCKQVFPTAVVPIVGNAT